MENNENNENNYCVYMHISPNGKIYVGMTSTGVSVRWQNGNGYRKQELFYNAINKYGWHSFEHTVLFDNMSKEEAEAKEIELISYYKSDNRRYGYNIDHGGNCVGRMSDETKNKIRNARNGKTHTVSARKKMSESKRILMSNPVNNPMYGKHHTEETIKKISIAKTGVRHSQEAKEKMSDIRKGAYRSPVAQYSMDGEFISMYDGVLQAANMTNTNKNAISSCCRNNYKTAGGYIWRYEGDELTDNHIKWCNSHKLNKRVVMFDLDMNLIAEFDGILIASRHTGVNSSCIGACCNEAQKTAGGYIWKFKGK